MSKNIDLLIKELVHERIDNIVYPPSDEIWQNIKKRLRKQAKIEFFVKRLRPVYLSSAIITVMIILFFNFQLPVMAFANKFVKSIEEITASTFRIHKTVGDKQSNDIDDPRIGEAQSKVSFKLLVPEYVPKAYKLDKVDIINQKAGQEAAVFFYKNFNKNMDKDFIQVTQRSLSDDADISLNVQKEEDANIKYIKIDGIDYTLVNYEKNLNKLVWDHGNIDYKIDGRINENEILKIAKSMK